MNAPLTRNLVGIVAHKYLILSLLK